MAASDELKHKAAKWEVGPQQPLHQQQVRIKTINIAVHRHHAQRACCNKGVPTHQDQPFFLTITTPSDRLGRKHNCYCTGVLSHIFMHTMYKIATIDVRTHSCILPKSPIPEPHSICLPEPQEPPPDHSHCLIWLQDQSAVS